VLVGGVRNESHTDAVKRSHWIEREFRTKVEPVLNRAQVLTAISLCLLCVLLGACLHCALQECAFRKHTTVLFDGWPFLVRPA